MELLHCCRHCKTPLAAAERKYCSGCHFAVYCNRSCQVSDWPNHRVDCKEIGVSHAAHRESTKLIESFIPRIAPGASQLAMSQQSNGSKGVVIWDVDTMVSAQSPFTLSWWDFSDLEASAIPSSEELHRLKSMWTADTFILCVVSENRLVEVLRMRIQ